LGAASEVSWIDTPLRSSSDGDWMTRRWVDIAIKKQRPRGEQRAEPYGDDRDERVWLTAPCAVDDGVE